MHIKRRTFLMMAGAAASAGVAGGPREAQAVRSRPVRDNTHAMLVDTTRCVGCRACEAACSEANHLPAPPAETELSPRGQIRRTDSRAYTVVNRVSSATSAGGPVFVKTQCMHCVQPACASACLVKALDKTAEGPVVYHPDRCLGCRYCMVACPFDIPKFEYEKAIPLIQKCSFCPERLAQGKGPACASVCPTGTLQFGKREDLLDVAKSRIYQNPDGYVRRIYGEHEVGGTGWLYVSRVPSEELGFRADLGTTPYPHFTWPFLSAVPFVLMLWPPFLMGIYSFTKSREEAARVAPVEVRHD